MCCDFKDMRKMMFFIGIIVAIVSTIGLISVHYIVENLTSGWFLGEQNWQFLYKLFIFFFFTSYTFLVVIATIKYTASKKVCSATNFKLMILSGLLFYPLGW